MFNNRDKTEHVAVVTGASAGVGRATALEFVRRGVRVGLLARNRERLDSLIDEIHERGGEAIALVADVADPDAVEAAAEQCELMLGPITIWVNCAMTTVFSPALEMSSDEYRRVSDVNYHGTVYGTLAALRRMRERNHGIILQCGSAMAYRGIPLQSAYSGSKFAVRGFTDALRAELLYEKSKVRISMVQLAAFNTPQFEWARSRLHVPPQPLPPVFQPELAARAMVHAAFHYRREWQVGFPSFKTIVGSKLFPQLADYMAAQQAWEGQMDSEANGSGARADHDNLYQSVEGHYDSHGRFSDEAKSRSWQWELSKRRGPIALGLGLAAVACTLAELSRRHDRLEGRSDARSHF